MASAQRRAAVDFGRLERPDRKRYQAVRLRDPLELQLRDHTWLAHIAHYAKKELLGLMAIALVGDEGRDMLRSLHV